MLNRLQNYRLTPLNPDPRRHAPEVRAREVLPHNSDDTLADNGAKWAQDGYCTLDRADPKAYNKNRRGIAPPALEQGPHNDWSDATGAAVLY